MRECLAHTHDHYPHHQTWKFLLKSMLGRSVSSSSVLFAVQPMISMKILTFPTAEHMRRLLEGNPRSSFKYSDIALKALYQFIFFIFLKPADLLTNLATRRFWTRRTTATPRARSFQISQPSVVRHPAILPAISEFTTISEFTNSWLNGSELCHEPPIQKIDQEQKLYK
jgi:hypothetical protein